MSYFGQINYKCGHVRTVMLKSKHLAGTRDRDLDCSKCRAKKARKPELVIVVDSLIPGVNPVHRNGWIYDPGDIIPERVPNLPLSALSSAVADDVRKTIRRSEKHLDGPMYRRKRYCAFTIFRDKATEYGFDRDIQYEEGMLEAIIRMVKSAKKKVKW